MLQLGILLSCKRPPVCETNRDAVFVPSRAHKLGAISPILLAISTDTNLIMS